ncbi:MAG: hypothetical protein U0271_13710 [Polyangiaceae bacterium]
MADLLEATLAIAVCTAITLSFGCSDDDPSSGGSGGSGGAGASGATGPGGAGGSHNGGSSSGGAGGSNTGGSNTGGSSSGGAGGSNTGGAGGAPVNQSGNCDTDMDCPPTTHCVAIVPNGFRVCQLNIPPADACTGSALDECCTSADCTSPGAICVAAPAVPSCGGVEQEPHNVCAVDQCKVDGDCQQGYACVAAGTFGNKVRSCLYTRCRTDNECHANGEQGICATAQEPCCDNIAGLYCIYGSSCRNQDDCMQNQHCELGPGSPTCVDGPAICPL